MESHLLQMRGLKLDMLLDKGTFVESHLLQMRGLKLKSFMFNGGYFSRIFYRCVD